MYCVRRFIRPGDRANYDLKNENNNFVVAIYAMKSTRTQLSEKEMVE